jgi:hypothetical protein
MFHPDTPGMRRRGDLTVSSSKGAMAALVSLAAGQPTRHLIGMYVVTEADAAMLRPSGRRMKL